MPDDDQVPIGMLLTELNLRTDDRAEVRGLWYWQEMGLPNTVRERRACWSDLIAGRCRQLRIQGDWKQVSQIVQASDRAPDAANPQLSAPDEVLQVARQNPGLPVCLEDKELKDGAPRAVDLTLRVTDSVTAVIEQIHSRRDAVDLQIASNWSIDEGIIEYLTHLKP